MEVAAAVVAGAVVVDAGLLAVVLAMRLDSMVKGARSDDQRRMERLNRLIALYNLEQFCRNMAEHIKLINSAQS